MALWVGSYSDSGGEGLYPLAIEGSTLRLGRPHAKIANASFAAWCPRRRLAYFVDEQEAGRVAAWRRADGEWRQEAESGSGGSLPCYVAPHPHGTLLAAANYGDGAVGLLALDAASGSIGALVDLRRASGHGPDPERQDGPHAHCVLFSEDGAWLYHVDLGLDRVFRYRVEEGRLGEAEIVCEAPPGSGPRHLLLHPDGRHALLLCELSAELLLLERSPHAGFACIDRQPTLPESFDGENLGGHIALDPATGGVLVTNRGHDSLVAFDLAGGKLSRRGWARTGGASPRHFWTDGKVVAVAHEESGTVTLIPAPGKAGTASVLATVAVPGAAFLLETPE